ncbi:CAP domain-containing protein, partial [Syncephalastrum racemosum]
MVNFFTAAAAAVAFIAAGSQAAPAAEKLTVPQQNALDQHNMYRKKHSAAPLVWDAKLAEYAQKWSDGCDFKHSGGPYGELASGVQEYTKAVDMWYNEVKDYDYSKPGFSM